MNPPRENGFGGKNKASDAEETLRLLAHMPAPAGLEERVKNTLRMDSGAANVVAWPSDYRLKRRWTQSTWARCAAAAAIVVVVAGGSWSVYPHREATPAPKAIALPHPVAHGFENANAMRTPQTLQGPVLKKAPEKAVEPAKKAQRNGKSKPHAGAKPATKRATDEHSQ